MSHAYLSVRHILDEEPIRASAPCRIDSGGTWDIKSMALPFERMKPVTVNMALNLRTRITLHPFEDEWVKITSQGFSQSEEYRIDDLSFTSQFGLFFATVNYFGFHGLKLDISSEIPVKSALGGSSTALIALIKALSVLNTFVRKESLSNEEMLYLGYNLEDGMSGGGCGSQDQAAAVYGGVNQWIWKYGKHDLFYHREPLLDNDGMRELSKRILVAYSGKSHVSIETNRGYIRDFISGKSRSGWKRVNEIVGYFADAIRERQWNRGIEYLRKEMKIRREITPEALIPITSEMINTADKEGCGARFAGAGAGGCVWALGEPEQIERLRDLWNDLLSKNEDARILDCEIDPIGVE